MKHVRVWADVRVSGASHGSGHATRKAVGRAGNLRSLGERSDGPTISVTKDISLCAWRFASVRSEIFGRAPSSPSVHGTGTKRVYDEFMTPTDYRNALVIQFKH